MLAQSLIDLSQYNPGIVVGVLVTTFLAIMQVCQWVNKIRGGYKDKLESYHNQEAEKEKRDDAIEERFKSIEEKLNKDYVRIQKSESHLYEMTEYEKDINKKFDEMNDMLINLRLETMRGRILDFTPFAIDLSHLQSRERYTEIFKVHDDYLELIKQTGKENNFETYNFDLITTSYAQRSRRKLFTEDRYISSEHKSKKPHRHHNNGDEYNE